MRLAPAVEVASITEVYRDSLTLWPMLRRLPGEAHARCDLLRHRSIGRVVSLEVL